MPEPERILLEYEAAPFREPGARARFAIWIVLVGMVLIASPLWLWLKDNPHLPAVVGLTPELFFAGWLLLGTTMLGIAGLLNTTPVDAIRIARRASDWIILSGTAVCVASCLWLHGPSLSADMVRYRSDGLSWLVQGSPFQTSPAVTQQRLTSARINDSVLLALPTEPLLRTIYPPIAQTMFIACAGSELAVRQSDQPAVAQFSDWAGLAFTQYFVVWRASAGLMLIVCCAVSLRALHVVDLSPWYAILFAWNPLTIIETAGQGHVDILGVLFVLIALLLTFREKFVLAAIALAIASGVKPHAALLAPVLFALAARARTRAGTAAPPVSRGPCDPIWRKAWNAVADSDVRPTGVVCAFAVTLLIVYSPLIFVPANFRGWYETVQVYSATWEANGSVYELFTGPFRHGDGRSLERAKLLTRLLGGVGTFLTLYLCIRKRLPLADSAYWLFLIPLLLAPVVYPWYLLWGLAAVPLLQRTGGWTMLVWAATSGLSYQLLREPTWHLPAQLAMGEYLPVYAALACESIWLLRTPDEGEEFADRESRIAE